MIDRVGDEFVKKLEEERLSFSAYFNPDLKNQHLRWEVRIYGNRPLDGKDVIVCGETFSKAMNRARNRLNEIWEKQAEGIEPQAT